MLFIWFDSAIVPLFHLSTLYLHSPWTWSCHFLIWVTCPTGQENAKIHLSVTKDWLSRYIVWYIQLRNCHLPHRAGTSKLWPVRKYMFQSFACLGQPLMWRPEHCYSNLLLAMWDRDQIIYPCQTYQVVLLGQSPWLSWFSGQYCMMDFVLLSETCVYILREPIIPAFNLTICDNDM